jgi:hypothetical protein
LAIFDLWCFKKKFNTAQCNRAGAATPLFDVLSGQKVLSQILFSDPARGFVEMIAQLANGFDIKSLCAFAIVSELQILYHAITQGCHDIPPLVRVNGFGN